MYSGTTLTPFSGRILGGHQKLDRVARSHLKKILDDDSIFPKSKKILHFEGRKGPDAIKRKSPSVDEPWHYYSPFEKEDSELIELINDHYKKLVKEVKKKNEERVAFEAAWLAHALTDGLTPAHHYPYEESIEKIWESNKESRTTLRSKWFPPAVSVRDRLTKSWKVWGPKGLMSMHSLFELGIATIIAPLSMKESIPTKEDLKYARKIGHSEVFKQAAKEIAVYDVRHKLGPNIAKTIALVLYLALVDAGYINQNK